MSGTLFGYAWFLFFIFAISFKVIISIKVILFYILFLYYQPQFSFMFEKKKGIMKNDEQYYPWILELICVPCHKIAHTYPTHKGNFGNSLAYHKCFFPSQWVKIIVNHLARRLATIIDHAILISSTYNSFNYFWLFIYNIFIYTNINSFT